MNSKIHKFSPKLIKLITEKRNLINQKNLALAAKENRVNIHKILHFSKKKKHFVVIFFNYHSANLFIEHNQHCTSMKR